jgi:stage III sporulation protein SpoIIIAA
MAIVDILGDIATGYLDLEDTTMTDIFLDMGSRLSVKINGECIHLDRIIEHSDISNILEQLPGGGPDFMLSNRVIFGKTLHRLAAVTYDGTITGITIRIGRKVLGLLPVFEGLVEQKNLLLCGSPNVGKTTTLREICRYLSRGKCLCLIDTSGEVCGESGNRSHIVGTSRVFRPSNPTNQYMTLLDCVRNHSPDIIAIDELNTKGEVEVCQTIALRSIQMVASVHGNIQDLVFNAMLNKALGGSTQALVSDRVAIDGRKVVTQRTTRPIFDVVINITRGAHGLEYSFIEDVASNVTRIMQGKPVYIRRRRMVDEELLEFEEEVLFPME